MKIWNNYIEFYHNKYITFNWYLNITSNINFNISFYNFDFDLLNLISISSDWKLKHYPYFYINLFGLSIVIKR